MIRGTCDESRFTNHVFRTTQITYHESRITEAPLSIWFTDPTPEIFSQIHENTMPEQIGITITEIGDDFLVGEMPIDHRTVQPFRVMHGGASATLAETLGSVGAQMTVDSAKKRCVGLSLNVSHIRGVMEGGRVIGVARPFHMGRTTQVWDIQITDEREKLVTVARLTLAVLDQPGAVAR